MSRKWGATACDLLRRYRRGTTGDLGKEHLRTFQRLDFVGDGTIHAGGFLHLAEFGFHTLQVGNANSNSTHAQVFERIARSGNVVVHERAQNEHDGINLPNVGEELVAETFAFACAFHQATNVHHFDGGVHHLLAVRHLCQRIETRVEHLGHPDVGILRGERIWRGKCIGSGQCVVERRLARIGKSDQSEALHTTQRRYACSVRPAPQSSAVGQSPIIVTICIGELPMTSFDLDLSKYSLGWSDDVEYAFTPEKGLNNRVVEQISWWKVSPSGCARCGCVPQIRSTRSRWPSGSR